MVKDRCKAEGRVNHRTSGTHNNKRTAVGSCIKVELEHSRDAPAINTHRYRYQESKVVEKPHRVPIR